MKNNVFRLMIAVAIVFVLVSPATVGAQSDRCDAVAGLNVSTMCGPNQLMVSRKFLRPWRLIFNGTDMGAGLVISSQGGRYTIVWTVASLGSGWCQVRANSNERFYSVSCR